MEATPECWTTQKLTEQELMNHIESLVRHIGALRLGQTRAS